MRIRTGYSFRSAVGKLPDVFARLKDIEYPFFPITDRASTFGWVRWSNICKENGVKPIFGIEIGVSPEPSAKKPVIDHWTFIADKSIVPINILLETATAQFRYEPLLTIEQAMAADCIKIVGHKTDVDMIGPGTPDLFVGLSPSLSTAQFRKANVLGMEFIACSDNVFPSENDLPLYEIICGRNASIQSYPQFILGKQEWQESLARGVTACAHAWKNLIEVGNRVSAELKTGTLLVPEKPKTLRQMCIDAAPALGIDLSVPVYAARMEKELNLIARKLFEDYFHIIADIVSWARERMIVGPGRGSSCGSLVCYLLGITTINPVEHGLIFERFIDANRDDLPDIDIDFSDQKRHLVFERLMEKYGRDRVAHLGTVAMYRVASAMKETAAALDVPSWKIEKVSSSLASDAGDVHFNAKTLRESATCQSLLKDHPEMIIAGDLSNHPRHHSHHAAGIILTDGPVHQYVATDCRDGVTHCDQKDADSLGLLKIDVLGLTQLSIFEDALDMAGLPYDHLETIDLENPATFEILNKGHFSSIFQFNGAALQSLASQVKITCMDDIVAITALGRPGPLNSGAAREWVLRKNGVHKATVPHLLFEPYLRQTRGIIIYQEQIMEIGRNIGDLPWKDITGLRKAMSKSLGTEYFNQFGDRWKSAALKKGIPEEILEKVWNDLCKYGQWSFNKSHSVAYAKISYWCCWLKAHFPLEFAAATLNHEAEPNRQLNILRELADEGISYTAIDSEISTNKWLIRENNGVRSLVGPVQNVKGIGPKLAKQIVAARSKNERIPTHAQKLLTNPNTPIDSLWPIKDRINEIMPDPASRNIHTIPTAIGDIEFHDDWREYLFFVVVDRINPKNDGKLSTLNLALRDDTGIIYSKVTRLKYPAISKEIIDQCKPGKSIYAIAGAIIPQSSFLMIKNARYLGSMDNE